MRPQQPVLRNRRPGQRPRRDDPKERIPHRVVQRRALRQKLLRHLVGLLPGAKRQLPALRTRVAHLEHHALLDLKLEVGAEVLHIALRMVPREGVHVITHLRQQPLARSHRLVEAVRERIAKKRVPVRIDAVGPNRRNPLGGRRETLVGAAAGLRVEDAVAATEHQLIRYLVCHPEARREVGVLRVPGPAILRRHEDETTHQRQARPLRQRARRLEIKIVQPVEPLRPRQLHLPPQTHVQRQLAARAPGVLEVQPVVARRVRRANADRRAPARPHAEQQRRNAVAGHRTRHRRHRPRSQSPREVKRRGVEVGIVQPGRFAQPAKLQAVRAQLLRQVHLQIVRLPRHIQEPPIIQRSVTLHRKARIGLRLELRNQLRRKAQRRRVQPLRGRVLILPPPPRAEQHVNHPRRRRRNRRANHHVVPRIHVRKVRIRAVAEKHRRHVLLPRLRQSAEQRPLLALRPVDPHVKPVIHRIRLARRHEVPGVCTGIALRVRGRKQANHLRRHRINQRRRNPVARKRVADKPAAVRIRSRRKRIKNRRQRPVAVEGLRKVAAALQRRWHVRNVRARRTLPQALISGKEKQPARPLDRPAHGRAKLIALEQHARQPRPVVRPGVGVQLVVA